MSLLFTKSHKQFIGRREIVVPTQPEKTHFVKAYGPGKVPKNIDEPQNLAMCSLTGCGKDSAFQLSYRKATPFPDKVTCEKCIAKINKVEETLCLAKLLNTK